MDAETTWRREMELQAVSAVIASWDADSLARAVNDLRDVFDIDAASSASRQHYIDTGRYLLNSESPEPGDWGSSGWHQVLLWAAEDDSWAEGDYWEKLGEAEDATWD